MNEENNQNAINPSNEYIKKENNAANTFNLIIGIATLLIAILGATFAYFSATARSDENDVTVKSAYVSINYDGGTEIKASNLIPSTLNVTLKKYQKEIYAIDPDTELSVIQPYDPTIDNNEDGEVNEADGYITDYDTYGSEDVNRKCVDARGKEVCYVYQFSVVSDGAEDGETDIIASIKINNNKFDNLSYIVYEVDLLEKNGAVVKDKYGFGIVDVDNGNGYQRLKSNFEYVDENIDATEEIKKIQFDKFLKPYDIFGENEELVETVKPVVCLFGYKVDAAEKRVDDTSRCEMLRITNKVKHTYQVLIWLEETGEEQPEQGITFEGTVSIEVSGGIDTGEYGNGQISGQE